MIPVQIVKYLSLWRCIFCLAIHAYRWLIFNQYQKFTEMHSSVCYMKCHLRLWKWNKLFKKFPYVGLQSLFQLSTLAGDCLIFISWLRITSFCRSIAACLSCCIWKQFNGKGNFDVILLPFSKVDCPCLA